MRKQSWFSKMSRRFGGAVQTAGRSLRSRRRAMRKAFNTQFIESMEPRVLLSGTPGVEIIVDGTWTDEAPLYVGLNGLDAVDGGIATENDAVYADYTYTVTTDNDNVAATVMSGNPKLVLNIEFGTADDPRNGTMVFELFEDYVPETVAQIIKLVESGFYTNMTFHRVTRSGDGYGSDTDIIQAGQKTLDDDSTYSYPTQYLNDTDELTDVLTIDDEFHVNLQYTSSGLLAMAKQTPDDTATQEFFITGSEARYWDYNYSIFGRLVEGEEVRAAINAINTKTIQVHVDDDEDPTTDATNDQDDDSDTVDTPVDVDDVADEDVIITSATIIYDSNGGDTENATLQLKATDAITEPTDVQVTVVVKDNAPGGKESTVIFTVTLKPDNAVDPTILEGRFTIGENEQIQAVKYEYTVDYNDSTPYIIPVAPVIVAHDITEFTITGLSTDPDGYQDFDIQEFVTGSDTVTSTSATEYTFIELFNSSKLSNDKYNQDDTRNAFYYKNWVDSTEYTATSFDLPSGLVYTNAGTAQGVIDTTEGTTVVSDVTFEISITINDDDLAGVFQILVVSYNAVNGGETFEVNGVEYVVKYPSYFYDTQIIQYIIQPPPLTVTDMTTNDNTPTLVIEGLTVGDGSNVLQILDDQDNVIHEVEITTATMDVTFAELGDGTHVYKVVQVVNDAASEAVALTFTIDTGVPEAITNATPTQWAVVGKAFSYAVGLPAQDDGTTITYSLLGVDSTVVTLDDETGIISFNNNVTSADYPTVEFQIVAEDEAGNTTTAYATITVASVVEVSGTVTLDGQGVGGVTVYVDDNGNNQFDAGEGEDEESSAITASDGSYSFPHITTGAVVVHQVLDDGQVQASDSDNQLTLVQHVKSTATDDDDDELKWVGELAMSSDGKYVYATSGQNQASGNDAIAIYERNTQSGTLTLIQVLTKGDVADLEGPNALVISPDGRHLYVTSDTPSGTDDAVLIFTIDADTGTLTYADKFALGETDVADVVVSPDDEFVYVASQTSDAVTVLSRDRYTGLLTEVQEITDAVNLDGVKHLTLSADGTSLYAIGTNQITFYGVNLVTGELTYKQTLNNSNTSGLVLHTDRKGQAAITANGEYLYVTSPDSDKLNVFSRAANGVLTYESSLSLDIADASGVQVNTQGTKLYITSLNGDSLYVYDIDPADGTLTLDQTITQDGTDFLDQQTVGLSGAVSLILDPDGNDVYIASRASDSIGVYSNRTRATSGQAILLNLGVGAFVSDISFANTQQDVDIVSVEYNIQQFESENPKDTENPTDWQTQRSTIEDITLTFSHDLIQVDVGEIELVGLSLDGDNHAVEDSTPLSVANGDFTVTLSGNQIIIHGLDLADGAYRLKIPTTLLGTTDSPISSDYTETFHQLLGDMNGDKVFGISDIATLAYWYQPTEVGDSYSYIDVPAYLDLSGADGIIDQNDLDQFTSGFGQFLSQDLFDSVPVVSLSSTPQTQSILASFVSNPPQSASLTLVLSDDDEDDNNTGLLDELEDENIILQMLETE